MKFSSLVLLFVISFLSGIYAQQKNVLDEIRLQYEAFEYKEVINLSVEILKNKDLFSQHDIIEVLIMKAVSHYALADEEAAKKCFVEMLKTDRNCSLDSENVSPKIVGLFRQVRSEFMLADAEQPKTVNPVKTEPVKNESVKVEQPKTTSDLTIHSDYHEYKSSIAKSLIFPGWGHVSLGDKTKGWIISSAAAVSIGSMIYFIAKANTKENDYQNENNPALIKTKYDSYNNSYKIRNFLIASSILIWSYAQLDILFWRVDDSSELSLSVQKNMATECAINLNYSLGIQF